MWPDERELVALEDEAERLRARADQLLGEVMEALRRSRRDQWEREDREQWRPAEEIDLGEWIDERD